jgi:hypothetical protein
MIAHQAKRALREPRDRAASGEWVPSAFTWK